MPVVIHFPSKPQTGTQFAVRFVSKTYFIQFVDPISAGNSVVDTGSPGNLHVVRVLFQFGHPDPQVVQFIGEFADQFVISTDSAFGQSLGNDLSHFITGHGLVTLEGAIRIAVNNTGSRQFGHSAVGPVAGRQVGEGVGRKSSGADAQSHGHGKH